MKKHPRMLKLAGKLMLGHSMVFVDKFADDFAKYRAGSTNLYPVLVDVFKRFEDTFALAFKYRHFIEQNHKLHTGIHGPALMALIKRHDDITPHGYYMGPGNETFEFSKSLSKTLH